MDGKHLEERFEEWDVHQMREEIDRLRGELSRAAVREGEAREVLGAIKDAMGDSFRDSGHTGGHYSGGHYTIPVCLFCGLEDGHEDGCPGPDVERVLATPSPLADAAQEVLEAAVVEQQQECEAGDRPIPHEPLGKARAARRLALDRYRALLEGRNRGED